MTNETRVIQPTVASDHMTVNIAKGISDNFRKEYISVTPVTHNTQSKSEIVSVENTGQETGDVKYNVSSLTEIINNEIRRVNARSNQDRHTVDTTVVSTESGSSAGGVIGTSVESIQTESGSNAGIGSGTSVVTTETQSGSNTGSVIGSSVGGTQAESGTNAGSVTTVTNVTRVDVTTNIGGSQMAPASGASGSILVNSDLLDTSKATSLTKESVMGIDTGSTKDISKTDTIQIGGNSKTVTTSSNTESVSTVSNNINAGLPEIHVNPDISKGIKSVERLTITEHKVIREQTPRISKTSKTVTTVTTKTNQPLTVEQSFNTQSITTADNSQITGGNAVKVIDDVDKMGIIRSTDTGGFFTGDTSNVKTTSTDIGGFSTGDTSNVKIASTDIGGVSTVDTSNIKTASTVKTISTDIAGDNRDVKTGSTIAVGGNQGSVTKTVTVEKIQVSKGGASQMTTDSRTIGESSVDSTLGTDLHMQSTSGIGSSVDTRKSTQTASVVPVVSSSSDSHASVTNINSNTGSSQSAVNVVDKGNTIGSIGSIPSGVRQTSKTTVTVVETKSGGIRTGSNTRSGSKTSVVSISGDRQSSSTLDDTAVDQTLTAEISKSNEAGTIEKVIVTNTTDIKSSSSIPLDVSQTGETRSEHTVTVLETKSSGVGTDANTESGRKASVISTSGIKQSSDNVDGTTATEILTDKTIQSNVAEIGGPSVSDTGIKTIGIDTKIVNIAQTEDSKNSLLGSSSTSQTNRTETILTKASDTNIKTNTASADSTSSDIHRKASIGNGTPFIVETTIVETITRTFGRGKQGPGTNANLTMDTSHKSEQITVDNTDIGANRMESTMAEVNSNSVTKSESTVVKNITETESAGRVSFDTNLKTPGTLPSLPDNMSLISSLNTVKTNSQSSLQESSSLVVDQEPSTLPPIIAVNPEEIVQPADINIVPAGYIQDITTLPPIHVPVVDPLFITEQSMAKLVDAPRTEHVSVKTVKTIDNPTVESSIIRTGGTSRTKHVSVKTVKTIENPAVKSSVTRTGGVPRTEYVSVKTVKAIENPTVESSAIRTEGAPRTEHVSVKTVKTIKNPAVESSVSRTGGTSRTEHVSVKTIKTIENPVVESSVIRTGVAPRTEHVSVKTVKTIENPTVESSVIRTGGAPRTDHVSVKTVNTIENPTVESSVTHTGGAPRTEHMSVKTVKTIENPAVESSVTRTGGTSRTEHVSVKNVKKMENTKVESSVIRTGGAPRTEHASVKTVKTIEHPTVESSVVRTGVSPRTEHVSVKTVKTIENPIVESTVIRTGGAPQTEHVSVKTAKTIENPTMESSVTRTGGVSAIGNGDITYILNETTVHVFDSMNNSTVYKTTTKEIKAIGTDNSSNLNTDTGSQSVNSAVILQNVNDVSSTNKGGVITSVTTDNDMATSNKELTSVTESKSTTNKVVPLVEGNQSTSNKVVTVTRTETSSTTSKVDSSNSNDAIPSISVNTDGSTNKAVSSTQLNTETSVHETVNTKSANSVAVPGIIVDANLLDTMPRSKSEFQVASDTSSITNTNSDKLEIAILPSKSSISKVTTVISKTTSTGTGNTDMLGQTSSSGSVDLKSKISGNSASTSTNTIVETDSSSSSAPINTIATIETTKSIAGTDTSSVTDNKSTISDKSTSLVVSSNEGDTREIASGVHTGNIDASNVISSSTTTITKTKTSEIAASGSNAPTSTTKNIDTFGNEIKMSNSNFNTEIVDGSSIIEVVNAKISHNTAALADNSSNIEQTSNIVENTGINSNVAGNANVARIDSNIEITSANSGDTANILVDTTKGNDLNVVMTSGNNANIDASSTGAVVSGSLDSNALDTNISTLFLTGSTIDATTNKSTNYNFSISTDALFVDGKINKTSINEINSELSVNEEFQVSTETPSYGMDNLAVMSMVGGELGEGLGLGLGGGEMGENLHAGLLAGSLMAAAAGDMSSSVSMATHVLDTSFGDATLAETSNTTSDAINNAYFENESKVTNYVDTMGQDVGISNDHLNSATGEMSTTNNAMINSVTSDNQNSIGGIYQQNGGNLNLNTPRGVNKKTVETKTITKTFNTANTQPMISSTVDSTGLSYESLSKDNIKSGLNTNKVNAWGIVTNSNAGNKSPLITSDTSPGFEIKPVNIFNITTVEVFNNQSSVTLSNVESPATRVTKLTKLRDIPTIAGQDLPTANSISISENTISKTKEVRTDTGTKTKEINTDTGTKTKEMRTDAGTKTKEIRTDTGTKTKEIYTETGSNYVESSATTGGNYVKSNVDTRINYGANTADVGNTNVEREPTRPDVSRITRATPEYRILEEMVKMLQYLSEYFTVKSNTGYKIFGGTDNTVSQTSNENKILVVDKNSERTVSDTTNKQTNSNIAFLNNVKSQNEVVLTEEKFSTQQEVRRKLDQGLQTPVELDIPSVKTVIKTLENQSKAKMAEVKTDATVPQVVEQTTLPAMEAMSTPDMIYYTSTPFMISTSTPMPPTINDMFSTTEVPIAITTNGLPSRQGLKETANVDNVGIKSDKKVVTVSQTENVGTLQHDNLGIKSDKNVVTVTQSENTGAVQHDNLGIKSDKKVVTLAKTENVGAVRHNAVDGLGVNQVLKAESMKTDSQQQDTGEVLTSSTNGGIDNRTSTVIIIETITIETKKIPKSGVKQQREIVEVIEAPGTTVGTDIDTRVKSDVINTDTMITKNDRIMNEKRVNTEIVQNEAINHIIDTNTGNKKAEQTNTAQTELKTLNSHSMPIIDKEIITTKVKKIGSEAQNVIKIDAQTNMPTKSPSTTAILTVEENTPVQNINNIKDDRSTVVETTITKTVEKTPNNGKVNAVAIDVSASKTADLKMTTVDGHGNLENTGGSSTLVVTDTTAAPPLVAATTLDKITNNAKTESVHQIIEVQHVTKPENTLDITKPDTTLDITKSETTLNSNNVVTGEVYVTENINHEQKFTHKAAAGFTPRTHIEDPGVSPPSWLFDVATTVPTTTTTQRMPTRQILDVIGSMLPGNIISILLGFFNMFLQNFGLGLLILFSNC